MKVAEPEDEPDLKRWWSLWWPSVFGGGWFAITLVGEMQTAWWALIAGIVLQVLVVGSKVVRWLIDEARARSAQDSETGEG